MDLSLVSAVQQNFHGDGNIYTSAVQYGSRELPMATKHLESVVNMTEELNFEFF